MVSGGWRVTGATVRGAIHLRSGRPNQDAIGWSAPGDAAAPRILAVADGHGAPLHYRSQRGSRMAVRVAIRVLRRFADGVKPVAGSDGDRSLSEIQNQAVAGLPREIARAWQLEVSADLARRPISSYEVDELAERLPAASLARLGTDPAVAYGSTLVVALLTPAYALYAQLGDGDILVTGADGEPGRPPLPADPFLYANQTTSLCSPEAWRHLRVCLQPVTPDSARCVMLATDGYANSFEDPGGLAQAAADLCALSAELGMLELGRALPGWLRATSAQGSGDDISVALAAQRASQAGQSL